MLRTSQEETQPYGAKSDFFIKVPKKTENEQINAFGLFSLIAVHILGHEVMSTYQTY